VAGKAKAADVLPMRQAVAMAMYLKGKGKLRDSTLVAVTAGFGLRIGDALSLTWGDVLSDGKVRDTVTITETKTKKRRTVKVLPFVRKALEEWHVACAPVSPEELLFPGPKGKLSVQYAWQVVRKAAAEMGLRGHISPHSLRKAFCDYVYSFTRDPVMCARITGHSNPAQLLRYIGRVPEAEEQVWERMARDLSRVKV